MTISLLRGAEKVLVEPDECSDAELVTFVQETTGTLRRHEILLRGANSQLTRIDMDRHLRQQLYDVIYELSPIVEADTKAIEIVKRTLMERHPVWSA